MVILICSYKMLWCVDGMELNIVLTESSKKLCKTSSNM